jgi:hypothetical protein
MRMRAWASGVLGVVAMGAVVLGSAAHAQFEPNFASIGTVVAGQTMPLVLNPCNANLPGLCHSQPDRPAPHKAPARPAAPASFAYSATPALRHKAFADFIARAQAKNPQAAQAVQSALGRRDIARIYDGVAGPYGVGGDDLANATTAYLVLGWMIANGQQDVPGGKASVLAARRQVAAMLAGNPAAAPDRRAALGEEMKILFVVGHAGWRGAIQGGTLPAYSQGIAAQFQRQFGIDLHRTRLDAGGLHG